MIFYVLRLRLLNQLRQLAEAKVFLLALLLTLLTAFYAVIVIVILHNEEELAKVHLYVYLVAFAFGTIAMFRRFFPGYKPIRNFLPTYYPIAASNRFWVSLLSELTAPFFWHMLVGTFLIAAFNVQYTLYLLALLLALANSHLVVTNLQHLWETKLKPVGWAASLLSIGANVVAWLVAYYFAIAYLTPILAGLLVLNLFASMVVFSAAGFSAGKSFGHNIEGNIYLNLIVNNRKVWVSLLVGFVFKFGYGSVIIFDADRLNHGFVVYMLASPMVIFSYVFNNTFGYWHNLWLTYVYRTSEYLPLIKQHLRIVLPLLLLDAAFSLVMLYYKSNNLVFSFFYYFVNLLGCLGISILAIILFPKKINQAVSLKANTSPWPNFFIIALCGLLLLAIYFELVYYVATSLVLFGVWAIYKVATEAYPRKIPKIHSKLLSK